MANYDEIARKLAVAKRICIRPHIVRSPSGKWVATYGVYTGEGINPSVALSVLSFNKRLAECKFKPFEPWMAY